MSVSRWGETATLIIFFTVENWLTMLLLLNGYEEKQQFNHFFTVENRLTMLLLLNGYPVRLNKQAWRNNCTLQATYECSVPWVLRRKFFFVFHCAMNLSTLQCIQLILVFRNTSQIYPSYAYLGIDSPYMSCLQRHCKHLFAIFRCNIDLNLLLNFVRKFVDYDTLQKF